MIAGRPVVHGRDAAHRPGRQRVRLRLVRHRRVPHLQAATRETGRIYKISYGEPRQAQPVDLAKLTDDELVKLQLHRNDWYVRHARRLLQERAAKPGWKGDAGPRGDCGQMLDLGRARRAATAAGAVGAARHRRARRGRVCSRCSTTASEHVRAWAVQLLCENGDAARRRRWRSSRELAKSDPSPVVRLYLASALQRLPLEQRWDDRRGAGEPRRGRERRQPAADVLVRRSSRSSPTDPGAGAAARGRARRSRSSGSSSPGGWWMTRSPQGDKGDLAPLVAALGSARRAGAARPAARAPARACAAARAMKMPDGWAAVYAEAVARANASRPRARDGPRA